jgi:hypothetical protein
VSSRGTYRARPWRHDRQRKLPPSSALAAVCLGTPRRSLVSNGTGGSDFAPDDAVDRLETATPDRDTAVVPRRSGRPRRDYQPSLRASLVKSP